MYAFIVNPNARSGLGIEVWQTLETVLKERKIDYQVCLTRYPNHAAEYVRELTGASEDVTLVVLGGDGTLNEAVDGIRDLSKVTLAFIPIGSSNDFARSMKLSKDPVPALERILEPRDFIYLDIGRLSFDGGVRRFTVSSGIGFDADVCFHNTSSKFKRLLNKLRLGKLSYTGVALYLLLTLKPRPMSVTLDGETYSFQKAYFAAAMNQRYEGGGFRFCPAADPTDGTLDVIVVSDLPKPKVLLLLPTAFKGWHTRFKGIHIYTCRTAQVAVGDALPVHTDGEPAFRGKDITFLLESDKLRFIRS